MHAYLLFFLSFSDTGETRGGEQNQQFNFFAVIDVSKFLYFLPQMFAFYILL